METCGDCKHWSVPTWDTQGWGTCCQRSAARDKKTPAERVEATKIRLTVADASFSTRADFGCVMFDPKKKKGEKED